ncbi:unnamed protein product [Rotaria sp. Silwood1]|nr:unnamed protein product [Rotaria sp. Silwood1]
MSKAMGFELSMLLTTLFTIISCACVAFISNWKLTLAIISTVPFVIAGSYAFSKVTAKESRNELDAYSKAGEVVQEVFSSLRTVLSLNGAKFEETRYASELRATRRSTVRKGAAFGLLNGWIYLIGYIIYSISFIYGSFLMHHEGLQRLSFSDLLMIVIILGRAITRIAFFGPFFQLLEEARGALAPVFRLIDEEKNTSVNEAQILQDSVSSEEAININGDIQFDNVNFAYPTRSDVLVLQNLTLMARAGKITALVGSSGSGKSTWVSLLLRCYEPLSGCIKINDRPITDYNFKPFRQKIGVVSQEPILFATSIYENIRFGKENATKAEIEEAARQATAHDFIMQLPNKYDTVVGESGVQLSGGEKQRIALARALILFATSIHENIRFGKENATRTEIEEAAHQAHAHDFIMQLPNKYDTVVGERGVQLSGGEKQRIALARALVKQPTVLLLDEATSALDNTTEKIVQEALDQACKGRTTIVIAHRLTAVQNAHRIYVLDNGYVIEQGTHETLMSQEGSRYREIMRAQQREKTENDIDEITSTIQMEDDDQKQIFRCRNHSQHAYGETIGK